MSNIRTAMNRGAFDFLTKPIDFGDLETTIDKTIRHVAMLREARLRQAEAERAHASLSRYFSPEVAKRLVANGETDGMGVQWRDVGTIFTDIQGFTTLVESAAPDVLGTLLNEYVEGMTDVVFAHEGTVAKIIGDAIHVLFNAPGEQPDYATRAVACAHDLDFLGAGVQAALEEEGRQFRRHPDRRACRAPRWSAISAAAIISTTPRMATPSTPRRGWSPPTSISARACASARSIAKAAQSFKGRPVGDIVLRGRSEPLRTYEPLCDEAFAAPVTAQYTEAFAKLEAGDASAMPAFAALVGVHADDPLAGFHLKRLLNGAKGVRMQFE